MKKINLLVVLPSYAGGGAEKVVLSFLKHLDKKILDCTLLVIDASGPLKPVKPNYKIIELKISRLRFAIPRLLHNIKYVKPDIVFSTFPHITILLLIFKKIFLLNFKLIAREPNMISSALRRGAISTVIKILRRLLMPKTDAVIVTSNSMFSEALELGIPKRKIILLRNPIDENFIRKNISPVRYPGKGVRLISVGRLVYQKGFDRILPILKNLEEIHLTVLGEGPEIHNLKALSTRMKVQDKVQFLGYKKDPYSYIAAADYLVLPSRWEGLPNVALESLVLGTPVICFKEIVGLNDILRAVVKKSLYFCKDEENMEILLSNLPRRVDYQNPKIRNNLLNNFNNPQTFTLEIENFIKEMVFAKSN